MAILLVLGLDIIDYCDFLFHLEEEQKGSHAHPETVLSKSIKKINK